MSETLPSLHSQVTVSQQIATSQIATQRPISGESQLVRTPRVIFSEQKPELVVGKLSEAQLVTEAFPALEMYVRFLQTKILSDQHAFFLQFSKEPIENKNLLSEQTANLEMAVSMYGNGLISLGRASEMAEVDYEGMIEILESRGIALNFGPRTPEEAERQEGRFLESLKRKPAATR